MGVHKLEIELTDEMMEAVNRLSVEQKTSPSEVVVATLKDHLPLSEKSNEVSIAKRLEAMERAFALADSLGIGRSQEDIDRQVREFRADRTYDR
jgi:hypothetical protein